MTCSFSMLYRKLTLVEFEPKKIRLLKNTLSALAADVLHLCLLGGILARIFPAFSRSLRIQSECAKMREKCGPENLQIRTLFTQCSGCLKSDP